MRRKLLVLAVVISALLPFTLVFGQQASGLERELKAQLYDALVVICGEAPVTHVQKQKFIIEQMQKVIVESSDTTMVGKLEKVGIKLQ